MNSLLHNRWRWLLVLGVSTTVLGVIAGIASFQPNLTFEIWVGLIFIAVGLGHALCSLWGRSWGGFHFQLFGATYYILIGLLLLANPSIGLQALILVLAMLFIMQGMVQYALASESPDNITKNWMIISASLAVVLGGFIWSQWPSNTYWLIGLFVSIHLLFRGLSVIFLALATRKLAHWCAATPLEPQNLRECPPA
jgi:uncharacterized membrane protein HdeD (DUF308 family)